MSAITAPIQRHLDERLHGVLAIIGLHPRHLTNDAEVIQGHFQSSDSAVEHMKRIAFCALRWKLWKCARFSLKRFGRILEDGEPLRFIVPFKFCEPNGRWYRIAPFVIDLENTGREQGIVNVHAEAQEFRNYNMANIPVGVKTIARVFLDCTPITSARFNIRWSPWRAS